jgi:hypothetical protein
MSRKDGVEAAYRILLDRREGFERHGAIDMTGVSRVLELRAKWAEPKKALGDPAKYYDSRLYDAAMKRSSDRPGGLTRPRPVRLGAGRDAGCKPD